MLSSRFWDVSQHQGFTLLSFPYDFATPSGWQEESYLKTIQTEMTIEPKKLWPTFTTPSSSETKRRSMSTLKSSFIIQTLNTTSFLSLETTSTLLQLPLKRSTS